MDINSLKNLVTVDVGPLDVVVRMGWKSIANISEDNGLWFTTLADESNPINTVGYLTKDEALDGLVKYLSQE